MSNQSQGRRKSNFPALATIPSDATFDFVSANTNYKITVTNLQTGLGVTGTIVQDGDATGTPILDTQGSVNNIRNLEPGKGILAQVSPENGITLETNFTQSATGIAVIDDLTADEYTIRTLIAGDGIQVAQIGDSIQITSTGTPTSDKTLTTTTVTATGTINKANDLTFVDASGGDIAMTLPTAVGDTGVNLYIKRVDDTADTDVTITGNGSETIDGYDNITITFNQCLYVVSDGTNWRIA